MKKKYYSHIRNIYIYIVIFIIFTISAVYYISKVRLIDYKDTSDNKLYTEQMVENFDSRLSIGLGIYNQILQSPSVQTFLKTDLDYRNLISVMGNLQSLCGSFNDTNMEIAIGKTDCETVITSKCTNDLSIFFKDTLGITEDTGRKLLQTINLKKFSYQTSVSGSTASNKNILTYVISSNTINSNTKLVFFLIFDIDKLLPKNDFLANSSTVIYNGNVLYENIPSSLDKEKILSGVKDIHSNLNFKYSKKSSGNSTYHCMPSSWSDIVFFFITQPNHNSLEYTKLGLNTLLLAFLMLALGLFAATKLTNKLYSPVKHLLSNVKSSNDLLKDEFSTIENMLLSLNTENDRLTTAIEQKNNLLKTNLLRSLLLGFQFSKQECTNILSAQELDWIKHDISVAVYRLTDTSGNIFYENADSDISNKFHNIISVEINKEIQCEIIKISETNTAIIYKADSEETIKALLYKLLPYLEITFNISAVVAISQITSNLQNIHYAYSVALSMLENNFTNLMHNNILLREEMADPDYVSFYYPLEMESTLIDQTLNLITSGVESIIEQILCENFDKRSLSIEQISSLKLALFVTINRIINLLPGKTIKELQDEAVSYHEIEQCTTRDELKKVLMEMLTVIMKKLDAEKKTQTTSFAADLMEYISANYQKDIALTDVSRNFNLSASYLSTLFKNSFGENFKDYLNTYRIKKAKEIISENKYITVKELALLVGFNNSDTFIRVFKRYEGVSPGQYINQKYKS